MAISKSNTANLQSRVQQWAKQQGIQKDVPDLSLGQMQKASRALKVPLSEVIGLREDMTLSAASQIQDAGQFAAKDRAASQGAAPNYGGGKMATSPMFVGHGFKGGSAAQVGGAKGKGSAGFDSDLAMNAMGATRFANKVKVDQPYVEFKGYRGGNDNINAFFKSTYSTSDARKALDAFDFLSSSVEAKDYIGLKVNNGREEILSEIGVTPHNFDQHECVDAFDDSKYSMRDARRAVAQFPFLNNIAEAKAYIGLKIVNGTEDILSDRGIGARQPIENTDLFFKAGYTFEDAEAAVEAFDFLDNVAQAKGYIGLKVANGYEEMMREAGITPGNFDQHEMMSAFLVSNYSVSDAERAMEAFDFLPTLSDAKAYIGLKVINDTHEILNEKGVTSNPWDDHEQMDAFRGSAFSETDARATLMAFDFLDSVDDAKAYIGLKVINGTENILSDIGVSRQDWDAHECVAAYAKAGYTNADCDKAAKGWGFLDGRNDAREYIGLKVLNGAEHILAEVGISPRGVNNAFDFKADNGFWNKNNMGFDDKYADYDSDFGAKGLGYAKDWDYKK